MREKVLLMGKSGSGKTSMRSIIFANYIARDTMRLGVTIDVERSHVQFFGNLIFSIWDCGGQDSFMENYFSCQREHIFRNVHVLIFVFDVESLVPEKDFFYYEQCLEALQQNSPDAKIFCLIHKMDLVPEDTREATFRKCESHLHLISYPYKITAFKTSIWDETLYKAWSLIAHSLIPDVRLLETRLEKLRKICEADEVILFERATFLVISHATNSSTSYDPYRFEKISNIIKQFKLSCSKSQAHFQSIEIKNSSLSFWINRFTVNNTYIMIINTHSNVSSAIIRLNIQLARRYFDFFINT
ncbi:ras-related GTP-binding protein A-like isoform X3 [Schistocerca gregaria]|uniref:ras-related GTP-binding protein A-like isoform X3 n=1 Tax=Schistocerca gregaria TaxID=7010 RepID=UPI00211E1463|nr:ras-related GTP-binding protein A-like isoform X3 [Schistocerca gregaria]